MNDIRWIAIPRNLRIAGPLLPLLGDQPDQHERVLFVALVDVLATLDGYDSDEEGAAAVRSTLGLVLARESEMAG